MSKPLSGLGQCGGLEAVRVGPFWWWRWAVVSRRCDIPGIGYWSKRKALEFWHRAQAALPGRPAPWLLKRTGWRSYEVVR